jgi:hypothetical protein
MWRASEGARHFFYMKKKNTNDVTTAKLKNVFHQAGA